MPYRVRISSLYIGQGLANTIEVQEIGNPNSEFLVLYDFGTSSAEINAHAARDHVDACTNRRKVGGQRYIDALYISHMDGDHYNKLHLLQQSNIGSLFIGGANQDNINALGQYWIAWAVNPIHHVQPGHFIFFPQYRHIATNPYDRGFVVPPPNPPPPNPIPDPYQFHQFASDPNLVLICNPLCYQAGNVFHGAGQNFNINRGSLMLLVSLLRFDGVGAFMPEFSVLLTGDATRDTANLFLDVPANRFNFFQEYKFITAPHHGSSTTIRDGVGVYTTLNAFLDNYRPNTAVFSARDYGNYRHPNAGVFDIFEGFIDHNPPFPAPNPININPHPVQDHSVRLYDGGYELYNYNSHTYTTFIGLDFNVPPPNEFRNVIVTYDNTPGQAAATLMLNNVEF